MALNVFVDTFLPQPEKCRNERVNELLQSKFVCRSYFDLSLQQISRYYWRVYYQKYRIVTRRIYCIRTDSVNVLR